MSVARTPGASGLRYAWFFAVSLVVASTVCCGARAQTDEGPFEDHRVKVALLQQFVLFVDWPDGTFADPAQPFVIGLLGDDRVTRQLQHDAASWTLKGVPVQVRRLRSLEEIEPCHLLWIAEDRESDLATILLITGDEPILTVSDTAGFGERGALINIQMVGGRLGFEINLAAVRDSGLVFNTRLLRLGILVGEESGVPP